MSENSQIVSQLKILHRLYKAEAIAFKLFYSARSKMYNYIKTSIDGEINITLDVYHRLINDQYNISEEEAEALETGAMKINYDLNQALVNAAILQDLFEAVSKFETREFARPGWDAIKQSILDIRSTIIDMVPPDYRVEEERVPIAVTKLDEIRESA